ncbi:MAG: ABC transporter permease [Nocardioides sp.]|uniref:FtsX-like permease family protein n=1 Tax=Nocardioides sp. TaxID=35761 RepID=UPI0039E5385D
MNGQRRSAVLIDVAVASVRQRWTMFVGAFVALGLGTALLATSIITLSATSGDGLGKARSVAQVTTALSVMVVVFVLVGTFAFVVDQRARELALLSLLGTTPRRIRRLIRIETVIVGGAAALTGCIFGLPGALVLRQWMVANDIATRSYDVGFHLGALGIAFLVGVVAAVVGASSAAWRASRARPLDALREAAASPRVMTPLRVVLGVIVLIGAATVALVMSVVSPRNAASPGSFFPVPVLCAIGFALLAPVLARPVTRLVTWPLMGRGALVVVIRQSTLNGGRRVAALVASVVLAVGMCTGMLAMEDTARAATVELMPSLTHLAEMVQSEAESTRLANVVILGIALVYTLVAIANTLMMNVSARSRELEALGFAGATRRQVIWVLLGEALLTVTVGALVGITGAVASQVLQRLALVRIVDDLPIDFPWLSGITIVLVRAATAAIAVFGAAWRATWVQARAVAAE